MLKYGQKNQLPKQLIIKIHVDLFFEETRSISVIIEYHKRTGMILSKASFMSKKQVKLNYTRTRTYIKNIFVWYQQNVVHAKFV